MQCKPAVYVAIMFPKSRDPSLSSISAPGPLIKMNFK